MSVKNTTKQQRLDSGSKCPECGCAKGHRIDCKTGNEKARVYQAGLAAKHRKKRKSMFTVEQVVAWMDRNGLDCSTGDARTAMEDAATLPRAVTKP